MGAGRDLFARRKDGGEFLVEIGLNPIHTQDGLFVLTVIVDISARRQAEEALEKERAFLRQVIDIDPNFIFAKDREGRFTLVNQAVADRLRHDGGGLDRQNRRGFQFPSR